MDVTGLIIRSTDYGEKDKIITLATVDGTVTAKAKGVRSPKSKLKGFVGVLSFGEFTLTDGKAGFILSGADVQECFSNCWTDPERYASAMFCLEIYEKCASSGDDPGLVSLLRALEKINYGDFYPLAAALKFGVDTAVKMGVDVEEGVFPDKISAIFSALSNNDDVESALSDMGIAEVKICLRHLAAGFLSELGIKLTVIGEMLNM